MGDGRSDGKSASSFPSTSWSELAAAAQENGTAFQPVLSRVLEKYCAPLQTYLVGRLGSVEAAEDLLHNFIRSKILEQNMLLEASRARGRFRTFLLTSLERFAISEFRKDHAKKRRPPGGFVQIEQLPEAAASVAEANFDELWARRVLERTIERMRRECKKQGLHLQWTVFESRILKCILEGCKPMPCKELSKKLGRNGATNIHRELKRGKSMFARTLRRVVGEYVPPAEVEDEIRQLRLDLSKGNEKRGTNSP